MGWGPRLGGGARGGVGGGGSCGVGCGAGGCGGGGCGGGARVGVGGREAMPLSHSYLLAPLPRQRHSPTRITLCRSSEYILIKFSTSIDLLQEGLMTY